MKASTIRHARHRFIRPAAVLAAILSILAAASCSAQSEKIADPSASTPASSATGASPTDSPTAGQDSVVASTVAPDQASEQLVGSLLVLAPEAEERNSELSQIATGALLEDLTIAAQEMSEEGLQVQGSASVVAVEVMEENLDAEPPSFVFRACVDSSAVQVIDDNGQAVANQQHPLRSWTWFTVVDEGGNWMLSAQSFRDEVDC